MPLNWASSSLSYYHGFTAKDARPDTNRGKADGRRNFPPFNATDFSPYELQLIAEGRTALARFARHGEEELKRVNRALSVKEYDRDQGYKAKRDTLQKDKDAAIDNLRGTTGPASSQVLDLTDRLAEKKQAAQIIELELNRPLRVHFARTYPFFLTGLALAEVPINKLAFEFFFDESPWIALGIALMVGVLFISLAHIVGIWLRQAHHYPSLYGRIAAFLGSLLVVCVVAALIYFIAVLRQQFVEFLEQEQAFSLSDFIARGGIVNLARQAPTIVLGDASLTLLFINVCVFVFGTVLSFIRHDPHPDYEQATRQKEKIERKLQQLSQRFDHELSEINRLFDKKIGYLNVLIDKSEAEIATLEGERDAIANGQDEAVRLVTTVVQQRVVAYQAGNTESRMDSQPRYFGKPALALLTEPVSVE